MLQQNRVILGITPYLCSRSTLRNLIVQIYCNLVNLQQKNQKASHIRQKWNVYVVIRLTGDRRIVFYSICSMCMKTLAPLLNCIVNDARVDVTPHLLQMLFQFISVVHLRLVHSRLDDAPVPVIKWWAVHWPKIRWNERLRRCLIEKSHIVVCPVCWGVLLNFPR